MSKLKNDVHVCRWHIDTPLIVHIKDEKTILHCPSCGREELAAIEFMSLMYKNQQEQE